ncbi:MAG: hypothetical protein LAT51_10210 [Flavobacteriaceae bacterium]|nr:hypothetical protein [Flavobacteriaceae bacterium]
MKRVCIYAKDIQQITGRSERYAYKVLSKIKKEKGKRKNQFVTIQEFAEYSGIDQKLIEETIY